MKTRIDFVTNSSSSSFIIAKKKGLSEKQKEALADLIERELCGRIFLTCEATDDEIKEFVDDYMYRFSDETGKKTVQEELASGKDIRMGRVDFEEADYCYADLIQSIWNVLEENSDGDMTIIDGSLDY